MTKEQKVINNWKKATQAVADTFTNKYFDEQEHYWVADDVGGVFCVSDYFFDVDYMLTALELQATDEQLFDYYHYESEYKSSEGYDKPTPINFRNYIKYGAIGK